MKSWGRLGILAVVVVAASFLLKATLLRPKPVDVEVARVARGVVEDAVTNSQAGTVRSRLKARVGAERAGRVVAIPHREGAAVSIGDLLLRLDDVTARTRLELAERDHRALSAAAGAARAAARLAEQDHERSKRLFDQGAVSQGTMDQAITKLESARAELEAAEARALSARSAVRLARDELDHLNVTAPFSGVVTQRFVEIGESVVPGQAVLEVMSPDSLYVSAPIDEIDIGRIAAGLPARVSLDPFPGVVWAARVGRVAPYVDDFKEQNRTLEVEVDLPIDPARPMPKPGTSADVEIILDDRPDALRVPTFAVIEGKRVLVAENGKAVTREVDTGIRNWEWTEIRGGLAEGDLVITNLDKPGVKAGARVNVPAAGAENGSGSPPVAGGSNGARGS